MQSNIERLSSLITYLFVARTEKRTVTGDTHTMHRDVILWNQLVCTHALSQVPDSHRTGTIPADELSLVWVDDNIVNGRLVDIVALQTACASVPDLDGSVFRAGNHPLAFTVEGDSGDIVCVAIEGHDRVGVAGLDIVELDIGVSGGGEVTFIGRNTQTIHLRVGMLQSARADP